MPAWWVDTVETQMQLCKSLHYGSDEVCRRWVLSEASERVAGGFGREWVRFVGLGALIIPSSCLELMPNHQHGEIILFSFLFVYFVLLCSNRTLLWWWRSHISLVDLKFKVSRSPGPSPSHYESVSSGYPICLYSLTDGSVAPNNSSLDACHQ